VTEAVAAALATTKKDVSTAEPAWLRQRSCRQTREEPD
jgi:hypothetical protein